MPIYFQEDQFWDLLTNILQTAGIVSSELSTQLKGGTHFILQKCLSSETLHESWNRFINVFIYYCELDVDKEHFSLNNSLSAVLCIPTYLSECRKLVAAGLWQTGYYADWMFGRTEGAGGGEGFSSRDLLLALGWLLAAGTLEKLLTRRVQQLDKTLLTSVSVSVTGVHRASGRESYQSHILVFVYFMCSGGKIWAFQWAPAWLCLPEETSVAHWTSEAPGTDTAVHHTCENTSASCCEETFTNWCSVSVSDLHFKLLINGFNELFIEQTVVLKPNKWINTPSAFFCQPFLFCIFFLQSKVFSTAGGSYMCLCTWFKMNSTVNLISCWSLLIIICVFVPGLCLSAAALWCFRSIFEVETGGEGLLDLDGAWVPQICSTPSYVVDNARKCSVF